jgi:hypothetical protein
MDFRRLTFLVLSALASASPRGARADDGLVPAPAPSSLLAVLAGAEWYSGDPGITAFSIRGDLEFAQRRLSGATTLSMVGSLGYSHLEGEVTDWFDFLDGEALGSTVHLLRLSLGARFKFGESLVFRPYLDGSVGAALPFVSVEYTSGLTGEHYSAWDAGLGLSLRVAAGATAQVSPGFALGAEVGLEPYLAGGFGPLSLLASATFRM